MLLSTISTIVSTETLFDIRNSFKVKSSLAKVNFQLKMNTLDVSTTEKVTNIIHKLINSKDTRMMPMAVMVL